MRVWYGYVGEGMLEIGRWCKGQNKMGLTRMKGTKTTTEKCVTRKKKGGKIAEQNIAAQYGSDCERGSGPERNATHGESERWVKR